MDRTDEADKVWLRCVALLDVRSVKLRGWKRKDGSEWGDGGCGCGWEGASLGRSLGMARSIENVRLVLRSPHSNLAHYIHMAQHTKMVTATWLAYLITIGRPNSDP